MSYYCRIDSSGEETNLQLYSLKEAVKHCEVLCSAVGTAPDEDGSASETSAEGGEDPKTDR